MRDASAGKAAARRIQNEEQMDITLKHKVMLGLALTMVATVFLLFFNLYRHDTKALSDFLESYEKYDHTISEFSKSVLTNPDDELERKPEEAFSELKAKAAALSGISSLIKNDSVIPPAGKEIVDFSENELGHFLLIPDHT